MPAQTWLAVATFTLAVATTFVGVVLWTHRKVYDSGKEAGAVDHRFAMLELTQASLTRRMDLAGGLTSELATAVQGLPEKIRAETAAQYQSLQVSTVRWETNARDHADFEARIQTIWDAVIPKRRSRDA